MSCRVDFNKDKSVKQVYTTNGNVSSLYNEALGVFEDSGQAMSIVYVAEEDDFLDKVKFKGEEPSLKQVLNYMNTKKAVESTPTLQDKVDIISIMESTGIETIPFLDSFLQDNFKKDGILTLDQTTLTQSNLYSEVEVINILSDYRKIQKLDTFINVVSGMAIREEDINTVSQIEENDLKDTSRTTAIGTHQKMSDLEVDTMIADTTKGAKTLKEFTDRIQTLEIPSIVTKFNENKTFAEELFNQYKNYKQVKTAEISEGQLSHRKKGAHEALLQGTILVNTSNSVLKSDIEDFASIDRVVKEQFPNETIAVIKELELELKQLKGQL